MLRETVFTGGGGGVGVGVGSISGFPILGFFDFGTSILGQGVGVDVDVEGILLGLGVLVVRLSLIRGSGGAEGVGGAGGAEGRRFRGIFSFNISYLGKGKSIKINSVVVQGRMSVSCYFTAFFGGVLQKRLKSANFRPLSLKLNITVQCFIEISAIRAKIASPTTF